MKTNPCPCPNLNCPNHGVCENCTSRHLKIGTLNYCGFYAILPKLKEAINADPQSATAVQLKQIINKQEDAYAKLMCSHEISFERQQELKQAKTLHSDY